MKVKRKFGIEILKLCLNNVELAFYYLRLNKHGWG